MWKYILTAILLILILIIAIVVIKRKKNAAAARLNAAAVLLREGQLDNAISRDRVQEPGRIRPVLELTWKNRERKTFLFDPLSPVRIGKDPAKNSICIRNGMVGSEHCLLVMHNGALTLQDLNSKNGTYIRRGGRRYRIEGRVYVNNGDKIEVGGLIMKASLFMYDSAYI